MAGTSASNVAVGKPNLELSGGIFWAPKGSSRPTDYATPLDSAYISLGYVGPDGVTESTNRSTEEIRVWGGVKVRTVQTEFGVNLTFALYESRRADALRFIFGEQNVVEAGGAITVKRNEKSLPHGQIVVEMLDMELSRRLDVGNAQVVEVGDITYVDGEAIAYEVTVSCDPDENGDSLVEYIQTGAAEAP